MEKRTFAENLWIISSFVDVFGALFQFPLFNIFFLIFFLVVRIAKEMFIFIMLMLNCLFIDNTNGIFAYFCLVCSMLAIHTKTSNTILGYRVHTGLAFVVFSALLHFDIASQIVRYRSATQVNDFFVLSRMFSLSNCQFLMVLHTCFCVGMANQVKVSHFNSRAVMFEDGPDMALQAVLACILCSHATFGEFKHFTKLISNIPTMLMWDFIYRDRHNYLEYSRLQLKIFKWLIPADLAVVWNKYLENVRVFAFFIILGILGRAGESLQIYPEVFRGTKDVIAVVLVILYFVDCINAWMFWGIGTWISRQVYDIRDKKKLDPLILASLWCFLLWTVWTLSQNDIIKHVLKELFDSDKHLDSYLKYVNVSKSFISKATKQLCNETFFHSWLNHMHLKTIMQRNIL